MDEALAFSFPFVPGSLFPVKSKLALKIQDYVVLDKGPCDATGTQNLKKQNNFESHDKKTIDTLCMP